MKFNRRLNICQKMSLAFDFLNCEYLSFLRLQSIYNAHYFRSTLNQINSITSTIAIRPKSSSTFLIYDIL
ncbi:hypothetical protein BCAR13_560115 [Paraburkholderia caribensis]|nr:hypothetical protein BCAR13_560115 [Paraburkholderia caribensis]